jgi:hypothetical protein
MGSAKIVLLILGKDLEHAHTIDAKSFPVFHGIGEQTGIMVTM